MNKYLITSFVAGTVFLAGPATTFAAGAKTEAKAVTNVKAAPASDVTEEELLNVIENSASSPMMDGRVGGMIAPYFGNGVVVDASVTKEVTPDFIALNVYCDSGKMASRETAKDAMNQIYNDIKAAVGADGRVRRQGSVTVYPYYGETGTDSGSFTANLSMMIRILKPAATQRISDIVEEKGCSPNWDVRLVDSQTYEMDVLDDLTSRLNKRKQVFEKLLGKKLTTVSSVSLSTWVDGYSSYDPETNKAEATTTLSVSFDLGARTTIPTTRSSTRATPKG
jgi:hypothetical protein